MPQWDMTQPFCSVIALQIASFSMLKEGLRHYSVANKTDLLSKIVSHGVSRTAFAIPSRFFFFKKSMPFSILSFQIETQVKSLVGSMEMVVWFSGL